MAEKGIGKTLGQEMAKLTQATDCALTQLRVGNLIIRSGVATEQADALSYSESNHRFHRASFS